MYFTLQAYPGFNISVLDDFGVMGEYGLFMGNIAIGNETTQIHWGDNKDTVKGEKKLPYLTYEIYLSF